MTTSKQTSELLSLREAAAFLRAHPNTLRQWDRKGILLSIRFGERKVRKYQKADLERFLQSDRPPSSEELSKSPPASASLPTEYGDFLITVWNQQRGQEPAALATMHLNPVVPVLVRVHSECLTGDVFHSLRCDCGAQRDQALKLIQASGNGIFILLRQEGRGIGLYEKIKAYAIQEKGYDTFEANTQLGHAPDAREYSFVKTILSHFGVSKIRLLTNNPSKISALAQLGIDVVERVPLIVQPKGQNRSYLETKQKKFKHFFGEESNYFFQCSDVEHPSQVEEIGLWMQGKIRDPFLRICVGVSANAQTLNDDLACKNVADIFAVAKTFPNFVPVLHFNFQSSLHPLEEIDRIRERLPFVEYLQLNDIRDHYTQILQKAVQHFFVDVPLDDQTFHYIEDKTFVDLIKNNKAFICLDESKGRGIAMTFENYKERIDQLSQKGINDIAVYGGFGPKRLETYERLRRYYRFNLSIDAETHLKTNGHLDTKKALAYLEELLQIKI